MQADLEHDVSVQSDLRHLVRLVSVCAEDRYMSKRFEQMIDASEVDLDEASDKNNLP